MDNIKKVIWICMILISVAPVLGAEFDNMGWHDADKNTITVRNMFILNKIAVYTLIENSEYCLVDCYAKGNLTLYTKRDVFSDVQFEDYKGDGTTIRDSTFMIKYNESHTRTITDYEQVCGDVWDDVNKTTNNICRQEAKGTHQETYYTQTWKQYKGEDLEPGNYEWELRGSKKPNDLVDWVISAMGVEFKEWAFWLPAWGYYINATVHNNEAFNVYHYPIIFNINTSALISAGKMNADCSDVRWLDGRGATLSYNITGCNTLVTNMTVAVNMSSNDIFNISMYYGNPASGATTATIVNPYVTDNETIALYNFNEASGVSVSDNSNNTYNAENFQGTDIPTWNESNCRFGSCLSFERNNQNVTILSPGEHTSRNFTMEAQIKPSAGLNNDVALYAKDNGGDGLFLQMGAGYVRCFDEEAPTYIASNAVSADPTAVHQYACVKNDSHLALVIDSVVKAQVAFTSGAGQGSANKFIIGMKDDGSFAFDGNIDSVRLSNTYRTSFYPLANQPTYTGGTAGLEEAGIVKPNVENIFPKNSTITQVNDVNFTYNVTDDGTVVNCTLFLNDVLTDTTTVTPVQQFVNNTFNLTVADGITKWKLGCYDNGANQGNSTTFQLTIDNTAPVVNQAVNITTLTTTSLPVPSNWNYTSSDAGVGLDTCWYHTSDSNVNVTVTCNVANIVTSWTSEGDKTIKYCANDTLNFETCRQDSLTVNFYNWTQKVDKTSIGEGDDALFELVLNMTDINSRFPNTNAILVHNNTRYTATKIQHQNNFTFTKLLVIPQDSGIASGASVEWNWTYAIFNTTDTIVNTSTTAQTQTIFSMEIDNCTAFSRVIINYTVYDEETKVELGNATMQVNVDINSFLDPAVNWNYSTGQTNVTRISICVPNNILNFSDYNLDAITTYTSVDYVKEYHYIDDFNLTNSSSTQLISLYDLLSADSTSFLINFKDEFYLSIEGAIVDIHRFYVEDGIWRSVEMGRTDQAGQTKAHLVTEDIQYRFLVRVNGTIVFISTEYFALCQTAPCQISLFDIIDTSSEYDRFGNLLTSFNINENTRTIDFTFATDDGTSSTVSMNVTMVNSYLNTTVCAESQTSSGGTLSCTVGTVYENTTYIIDILQDGGFVEQQFMNLKPSAFDNFGYTGVFMAFLVMLFLALMGISSGIVMIAFTILGLISVTLLNIFDGGTIIGFGSAIIWLVVAGVIIIYKIVQGRYH